MPSQPSDNPTLPTGAQTPHVGAPSDGLPGPEPSPTTSWWVEGFASKLATEQVRMRNQRLPKPVQDYFDARLADEEAELLLRRRAKG